MRCLITGVGGFVGQHLALSLLRREDVVFGLARRPFDWQIGGVDRSPRVQLFQVDLRDREATLGVVRASAPERVYHLASASSVPESFADPGGTIANNVGGLVNLLEAVRQEAPLSRTLVVSSSEIYGRSVDGLPIGEQAELRPENPYAVSKAAQDLLGYQYFKSYGLNIVRARPFNHIGPGQSDRFAVSSFARQVAEIERGMLPPVIRVGNLEAQRDFSDVRDMVHAYTVAIERGLPGAAYNLGSGEAKSIRSLLDHLVSRSAVPLEVEIDPSRLRVVDAPQSICDPSVFRTLTGWVPAYKLDQTLDDMLTYWRERSKAD